MKRSAYAILVGIFLLVAADRLPAPILEQTPSSPSTVEQPKAPATKKQSAKSSESSPARRFDGTWRSASSYKAPNGNAFTDTATIVIRTGGSAEVTFEITATLARGKKWNNVDPPYNSISPMYTKWTNRSNDLKVEGSNLRISWPAKRLIDWSPKTIPSGAIKDSQGPASVLFILSGQQLILTTGKGGSRTYTRVR